MTAIPTTAITTGQHTPGYHAAAFHADSLLNRLATTSAPDERARLLLNLALTHHARVEHTPAARAAAQRVHEQAAALYMALSTVETAVAASSPRESCGDASIETAAGPILDRMAAEPDPARRASMLDELHQALGPVMESAVRVLAGLPAPGMRWQPIGVTR